MELGHTYIIRLKVLKYTTLISNLNNRSLANDRVGRLPEYLVNLLFRTKYHSTVRQVPTAATLDSLADVNWISRRLFLSLSDRFAIKCNVICRLADKSEVSITQCCNLDLSIDMKNSPKIRIKCRFLIMESSQDLVLGWEAISRFNLMQVNVANIVPQTNVNLTNSKIRKCKFNDDKNVNSFDLVNKYNINDMRPNMLK